MKYFILSFLFILVSRLGVFASQKVERPDTVQIGSYLISVHDINFKDKEYIVRFWVWMLYSNQDFDFEHRIEVPNAKSIEVQDKMIDSVQGKIWVLMKLRCVMKQSWSVNDFPFDTQKLEIKIENSEFDTRKLVFTPLKKGNFYDPEMVLDGWRIKSFQTSTSKSNYETDFGDVSLKEARSAYSAYNIKLEIERSAWWLFLKIFVGMYIAFFIAFISLFVKIDNVEPRFSLPVGGLFGSVGNKYIIDSILPETSTFTLADTLHALTFFCIFIIIANSVFALKNFHNGKKALARKIDLSGRVLIFIAYGFINFLAIAFAVFG